MKHIILRNTGSALLFAGLTFSLPIYADMHGGTDAMGMDDKSAMPMSDNDNQVQMGKMQESMLQMHEQMHKIMDAKDPQKREQLTQEHAKMMQDHMRMMHGMMGKGGMMGGDQHKQMDKMGKDMPAAPMHK